MEFFGGFDQNIGFDRNIFREKTLPAVIDYNHAISVRRGLVEHRTDGEWSSGTLRGGLAKVPRPFQGWGTAVSIRMDEPFA